MNALSGPNVKNLKNYKKGIGRGRNVGIPVSLDNY
jgi:hypothetical protein